MAANQQLILKYKDEAKVIHVSTAISERALAGFIRDVFTIPVNLDVTGIVTSDLVHFPLAVVISNPNQIPAGIVCEIITRFRTSTRELESKVRFSEAPQIETNG